MPEFPPWDTFAAVFKETPLKDLLDSLNNVVSERAESGYRVACWEDLVHYHIFSEPEIWSKGMHTKLSNERLHVV